MDQNVVSHPLSSTQTGDLNLPQQEFLVARQPIYSRQLDVVAYELLFRHNTLPHAESVAPYQATTQVLLQTFMELDINTLVGNKPAFINVTRGLLLMDYLQALPAERLGIEVLNDLALGPEVLAVLQEMAAQGYIIAIKDVTDPDELRPLAECADLIELDVQALDRATLEHLVAFLRPYEVKLVAKQVETHDAFRACHDMGFDYFQGHFLCQPDIIPGHRSPTTRLTLLPVMAALQDPDITFSELETLISRDASLSYKVLRLLNSAYFGFPRQIDSLRQALTLLGLNFLTPWVSMLLLAGIDDKPSELLFTAMVRAKMGEQLAHTLAPDRQAACFLSGLFSVLDALLDRPMPELLEALPLTEDLTLALLDHEGVIGDILHTIVAYERGCWETVDGSGLTSETLVDAYLMAVAWATEMSLELVA